MRVAITVDSPSDNAPVAPIFGRCAYYAVYDTDTDKIEFIPNSATMYPRGAGVQAAQQILSLGVQQVITAGIPGPNSSMILAQAGINVVSNFTGTVRDAVEALKSGKIEAKRVAMPPAYPNYPSYPSYAPFETPIGKEEEIRYLEEEKRYIEERLKEIKKRLKELQ